MDRSIPLFRVLGIRVGASPTWFLVLFLMIYWLSGYFGDVLSGYSNSVTFAVAVAATLLFFVSLLLHEFGHALVARRDGIDTEGIDLWLFGGIAKLSRDSRTPGEELRVAAAGPAVTALIVLVCVGAGLLARSLSGVVDTATLGHAATTPLVALIGWLTLINIVLLVFNLIPAFPLDGGRIARAIAWRLTGDRNRGTRFSARLGEVFSWLLIGVGAFWALRGDVTSGLWLAVLGWFLGSAARGAVAGTRFSERLAALTAGDLMDVTPVTIPGSTSALAAHDEWFARSRWPWLAVVDAHGRLEGILDAALVDRAVTEGRPALAVRDLLDPSDGAGWVTRETPVESLVSLDALRRLGAVMVVDGDDRLCGVVTVEQVRRALATAARARR